MRVLCISRHEFLSEHLCRYFSGLGAVCEGAVGSAAADSAAAHFEPHLIIAESELLNLQVLDEWSQARSLREVPVLAVSLTRRAEEHVSAELCGVAGVIYLPKLTHAQAKTLLAVIQKPRGVALPVGVGMAPSHHHVPAI